MSPRPESHPSDSIVTEPIEPLPRDTRVVPPWDDLEPGIRATVKALWEAGYEPIASSAGGEPPGPYVEVGATPMTLVIVADRLRRLVDSWLADGFVHERAAVTATYVPGERPVVVIAGVRL